MLKKIRVCTYLRIHVYFYIYEIYIVCSVQNCLSSGLHFLQKNQFEIVALEKLMVTLLLTSTKSMFVSSISWTKYLFSVVSITG